MRYGIFSDIHSNLGALEAIIKAYKLEGIDTYLCVGDIVGYATNPEECIAKIRAFTQVTVAGNHDWAAVDLFSIQNFNSFAAEAVIWTKGKLNDNDKFFLRSLHLLYRNKELTLVHGTLANPQEFHYLKDTYFAQETFDLMETDICFVGHTHVPCVFMQDKAGRLHYGQEGFIQISPGNKYIINVGSVGQPRDRNSQAAYCIYDNQARTVQIKRIAYDVEAVRKKIIAAGLPLFLGDRLLEGR